MQEKFAKRLHFESFCAKLQQTLRSAYGQTWEKSTKANEKLQFCPALQQLSSSLTSLAAARMQRFEVNLVKSRLYRDDMTSLIGHLALASI
tara:strand:- start:2466 stop:2738 length:273 start_codon:yes stop_codon:yes gene_type:complete